MGASTVLPTPPFLPKVALMTETANAITLLQVFSKAVRKQINKSDILV